MRWWKGGVPLGRFEARAKQKMIAEGRYYFDLRAVATLQLALVGIETFALLFLNENYVSW